MVRIPLSIVGNQLVLICAIECRRLRIHRQIIRFVIDTGSADSFISTKDATKLQIPLSGKSKSGEVDFGGSRYDKIELPEFTLYAFEEDNTHNKYISLKVLLNALRSNKKSEKNIQTAEALPSILGTKFLKEQGLKLYLDITEQITYLEK